MSAYIVYALSDGTQLPVEVEDETLGVIKASRDAVFKDAQVVFSEALGSIKTSLVELQQQFADLQSDEVSVEFGMKVTGEVGMFAICKAGGEATFTIAVKWKRHESSTAEG